VSVRPATTDLGTGSGGGGSDGLGAVVVVEAGGSGALVVVVLGAVVVVERVVVVFLSFGGFASVVGARPTNTTPMHARLTTMSIARTPSPTRTVMCSTPFPVRGNGFRRRASAAAPDMTQ
jgi:hypothetical protein